MFFVEYAANVHCPAEDTHNEFVTESLCIPEVGFDVNEKAGADSEPSGVRITPSNMMSVAVTLIRLTPPATRFMILAPSLYNPVLGSPVNPYVTAVNAPSGPAH
jgi:hypothetical protein